MKQRSMIYLPLMLFVLAFTWSETFAQEVSAERKAVDVNIDVGGYTLHFKHTPGVLPAIVFESGGGMYSAQWLMTQKELGSKIKNALVSYDRAGHWKSELPDTEYDIEVEMAALHTGLQELGVADEVFLAGHSYASFLMTMYAHKYPDTVKSVLYIDPNTIAFEDHRTESGMKREVDPDEVHKTKHEKATARLLKAFPNTLDTMRSVPLPQCPFLVISAGKKWLETEEDHNAFTQAHKVLAKASGSPLIIAEESDHFVPRRARGLVISTILEMLTNLD